MVSGWEKTEKFSEKLPLNYPGVEPGPMWSETGDQPPEPDFPRPF